MSTDQINATAVALSVYETAVTDPVTEPAALGLAVGTLVQTLGVGLKEAVLILEDAIKTRN